MKSLKQRQLINTCVHILLVGACLVSALPLISIFTYIVLRGAPGLSLHFFTGLPQPIGEPGSGMGNAISGTFVLLGIASGIGIPWGLVAGIFMTEYRDTRMASCVRFSAELLSSIPSIVIGLFIYEQIVLRMHHFSALAGGLALSIIMIPTIARSTEEQLLLIPAHIREAGLALGLPRWKVTCHILLPGIIRSIMTSMMLAIARISGETAPLLFTAFGSRFWPESIFEPIASLPIQIYNLAISPFEEWHQQAWTGAFILALFVLSLNIATRLVMRQKEPLS